MFEISAYDVRFSRYNDKCVTKLSHCTLTGQRFFRAQLYLTKVSARDLKHGSLEVEWSIDIIKWP